MRPSVLGAMLKSGSRSPIITMVRPAVAAVMIYDRKVGSEFCGLAFPCRVQYVCGTRKPSTLCHLLGRGGRPSGVEQWNHCVLRVLGFELTPIG